MVKSTTSSPAAPPPPPPPPPPQLELEGAQAKKPMDFRDIMALFHAREPAQDAWEALWLATLAEAPKRAQQSRSRAPPPADDYARASKGAFSSAPEPPKRPRQVRQVWGANTARRWKRSDGLSCLCLLAQTSAIDLEPNKLSRLNRAPVRPKAGGSKLLQKLGGARGT
ncbi:hypothetical protein PybrP1_002341 [[Pythium] brassicae (nom. inval.)]|nr:hypothetical protein PybrP1_002341 [[Pythium] brassicae (nom. inval.)]